MIILHKLEMDLAERDSKHRIDAVQGDTNTRYLELSLTSGGEAWPVPDDVSVCMRYCKSDGTKGIYDTLPDGSQAWKAEGNILQIAIAPQMLTVAGTVLAQAELKRGGDSVATFGVQICVEWNPAAGVLVSEDYQNMLHWMEEELDRRLEQARDSGDFDGPQGPQGPQGVQGPQGERGMDFFSGAQEAGYTGSLEDFWQMLLTPGLKLSGGTMSGNIHMGGSRITGLARPVEETDAVTKSYVDSKRFIWINTLSADLWTGTGPYTQTIVVSGIHFSDLPRILPVYTGNTATDVAVHGEFACVSYWVVWDNRITFWCLDGKPASDIQIYVEVLR